MRARRLHEIATVVEGHVVGEDVEVRSITADSRSVPAAALFVALPGTRTDGADHIDEAHESGAVAALAPEGTVTSVPAVLVGSAGAALMRLAADERRSMDALIVAITGANGKTTTKDFAAAVLGSSLRTHASPRSFNTEVGLPLTLLNAREDADVVVAEMGARHKGDVTELCAIARPHIAVVTNVGMAHIEIFGSWDAIVEAHAEPVEALDGGGIAILCADDPVVAGYRTRCAGETVTFGRSASADVRAEDVELDAEGRARFTIHAGGSASSVQLAVPGEHMVLNALAAVAVGLEFDIPLDAAAAALERAEVSPWRMETFTSASGVRVVNDAYNANPESVEAALKTARWMAGPAQLIAVLGPMAELGSFAMAEHERVGELAAKLRVDRLVTVGAGAYPIAVAGLREGVEPENVAAYDDEQEALADVRAHARAGDVVLFKASRVSGLERLAAALR